MKNPPLTIESFGELLTKLGYGTRVLTMLPESDLERDLGFDSLDRVELALELNRYAEIEMDPDRFADTVKTVRQAIDFTNATRGNKALGGNI